MFNIFSQGDKMETFQNVTHSQECIAEAKWEGTRKSWMELAKQKVH